MVKFLSKTRFNSHSNDQIIMLTEDYESIDFASQKWIEQLKQYGVTKIKFDYHLIKNITL